MAINLNITTGPVELLDGDTVIFTCDDNNSYTVDNITTKPSGEDSGAILFSGEFKGIIGDSEDDSNQKLTVEGKYFPERESTAENKGTMKIRP